MSNSAEKQFKVAVVGATGAVGEVMLSILAERDFPVGELVALASERSAGGTVKYGNRDVVVQDLATFDPAGVDIALFSAGGSTSKEYAPKFAAAGAVVIDNTSAFRYDADVPLVVREVNPEPPGSGRAGSSPIPTVRPCRCWWRWRRSIARQASSASMSPPTSRSPAAAARRWRSWVGRPRDILNFREAEPKRFPVQIAFNLIPHIDDFLDNGYTKEEMKLVWETRKILGDDAIQVNPTAVRVPVFYGHSEAVNIETREKMSAPRRAHCWRQPPGVTVVDEHAPGGYPTPVTHASGTDAVYVGRMREDSRIRAD